jgi:hypothetical protein
MTDNLKLIECPRDAWQGLKGQIPTEVKGFSQESELDRASPGDA